MRLLKFVLAAVFAALAMLTGLVLSLGLVVFGFAISLSRRWFGHRPRVPVRPAPQRARATARPATDDAIDVVVTEVPTAEAAARRAE